MDSSSPKSSHMATLHEQMTHLVNQLQLPLVEVSLVVAKYTRTLSKRLEQIAAENDEQLPDLLSEQWALENIVASTGGANSIELDTVLSIVDEQRMDIFDTLIRSVINMENMPLMDALIVLRKWEFQARTQLADASSPGQLFSPLDISDDY